MLSMKLVALLFAVCLLSGCAYVPKGHMVVEAAKVEKLLAIVEAQREVINAQREGMAEYNEQIGNILEQNAEEMKECKDWKARFLF